MREPEATLGAIFGLIVLCFLMGILGFIGVMICGHFGWLGIEYVSAEEVHRRWLETQ